MSRRRPKWGEPWAGEWGVERHLQASMTPRMRGWAWACLCQVPRHGSQAHGMLHAAWEL